MTVLEINQTEAASLGYRIFDADQHYYEAEDALTRHLPDEFKRLIRWIDVGSRRTLLVNNKLLTVVPNPTYDPVGVPGSLETYFRSENHDGIELRDMIKMHPIQPAYRYRDARVELMDAQGVEFAWLIPSLGLGVEQMLTDDPVVLNAVFGAYNRWLDDDWGYDRDGRIQTGPLISLVDPEWAEAETRRVIELGAKMICMRPAPVMAPGLWRSPGDPIHDGVWAQCAEAGVIVAIHAADSGYGRLLPDWGEGNGYKGMKMSNLEEVLSIHVERPIYDMMSAMICHGVFERHPNLKVATLELGSGWVPELVRRLKKAYGKKPQTFGSDPVEQFHNNVWVAPFYEDEMDALQVLGTDKILLGSDYPHPEGLPTPADAARDFAPLGDEVVRMVMRDNLAKLVGKA